MTSGQYSKFSKEAETINRLAHYLGRHHCLRVESSSLMILSYRRRILSSNTAGNTSAKSEEQEKLVICSAGCFARNITFNTLLITS